MGDDRLADFPLDQLSLFIEDENSSTVLPLSPDQGEGFVRIINLKRGIRCLILDAVCHKALALEYHLPREAVFGVFSPQGSSPFRLAFGGTERLHRGGSFFWGSFPGEGGAVSLSGEEPLRAAFIVAGRKDFGDSLPAEPSSGDHPVRRIFCGEVPGTAGAGSLSHRMGEILETLGRKSSGNHWDRLLQESALLELLSLTLEASAAAGPQEERMVLSRKDEELLHLARRILLENLDAPPTIKELSLRAGMNDCKLKKGFKQLFGSSVFEILTKVRMEKAAELLRIEGRPVTEIALSVGYSNPGAFAAAFRRFHGLSPREYRKRARGD